MIKPKSYLTKFCYIPTVFTPIFNLNPHTKQMLLSIFLDLLIYRKTQGLDIDINRKPTSTDTTIHFTFNHTMAEELAIYIFLINKIHLLPVTSQNKDKEWNTILCTARNNWFHCSLISKLNTRISCKLSLPPTHSVVLCTPKKWVTFAFYNPVIQNLQIFSRTAIFKLHFVLVTWVMTYSKSIHTIATPIHIVVYQLQCHTCDLSCIGQTEV
jgi:hypothetical protein